MPRNSLSDFEKKLRKQISDNLKKYSSHLTQNELSRLTGIPASTISGYFAMRSTPNAGNIQKLATALNCSKSDLDPRFSTNTLNSSSLNKKDERDIQKRLQNILDDLDDKAALNFYNGDEEMDEETKELLRISLESSIRLAKSRAKQKFTPNKYKDKKDWLPLDIKGTVNRLIKNNNTNNPFSICKALDIVVKYENLGNILGYCDTHFRMRTIHINENTPEHMHSFICAHELGHAILHPKINTPFLRNNTLFSVDKIERQANTFAVELLLPDSILQEHEDINFYALAKCHGIPNGLESLKFKWCSIYYYL